MIVLHSYRSRGRAPLLAPFAVPVALLAGVPVCLRCLRLWRVLRSRRPLLALLLCFRGDALDVAIFLLI